MYYLYFLICPLSLEVKYIGVSRSLHKRILNHLSQERCKAGCDPKLWERIKWMRRLKRKKLKPIMAIINEYNNEADALEREKELIIKYYNKITNVKYGLAHNKPI